jgi:hypothetical protein
MADLISEVQKEVARIREMITVTKEFFPNGNMNFFIYEEVLRRAEMAVMEQDTVSLIQILPELRRMD